MKLGLGRKRPQRDFDRTKRAANRPMTSDGRELGPKAAQAGMGILGLGPGYGLGAARATVVG